MARPATADDGGISGREFSDAGLPKRCRRDLPEPLQGVVGALVRHVPAREFTAITAGEEYARRGIFQPWRANIPTGPDSGGEPAAPHNCWTPNGDSGKRPLTREQTRADCCRCAPTSLQILTG